MKCTLADIEEVQRILADESVFFPAKDDGVVCVDGLAATVLADPRHIVLMPADDTLFLFTPINHIAFEMHVAIVSGKARKRGIDSAIKAARWMFANTSCQKIVAMIPEFHQTSILFASLCGLKREGLLYDAFQKGKMVYNVVILGATKKELFALHGEE